MKRKMNKILTRAMAAVLAAAIIPCGTASAAGENSGSLDELNTRGFSTHFMTGNTLDDMELLKESGARIVRDEVGWSMIEHQPGVYDFSSFSTTYPLNLAEKGLDIILVLDYQNDLYVTGALDTDYERNAFANYCIAVAKQYPQINKFEIWNEPNLWYDWNWHQDPTDYVKLLETASKALKSVNPNATVIGGALSDYEGIEPYITEFYAQSGLYSSADAVSIHPYWYYTTTSQRIFESRLRLHTRHLSAIGGFKDLNITEIGFPSYSDSNAQEPYPKSISEEEQAEKIIKSYVLGAHYNLNNVMIYDFKNDGTDPAEKEHNFGVINNDGTVKKAYSAIKEMNTRISGAPYMGTLTAKRHSSSVRTSTEIHIYDVDGTPVGIAWYYNDSNPSGTLDYTFNAPVDVYDMYGNQTGSSVKTVTLTNEPVYIYGISTDEMYNAATVLAADYISSAVSAASTVTGEYADDVKSGIGSINDAINNGISNAGDAKKVFDSIMELGSNIAAYYAGDAINATETAVGTILDHMSNAAYEVGKIYADCEGGGDEYYALTSDSEISASESAVSESKSNVAKAMLKRAKKYNENAYKLSCISGLNTGMGMTKAADMQAAGLAKWAQIMGSDASDAYIDASFDDNGYLTIRGMSGKTKKTVTVYVLKPSANGVISPEGIDYIDQFAGGEKSAFVKKYLSCGERGVYKVAVYSDTLGEIKTIDVAFYTDDDLSALSRKLKSASSADEAAEIMTSATEGNTMPSDILSGASVIFKQAVSDGMSLEQFGRYIYGRKSEISVDDTSKFLQLTDEIAAICGLNAAGAGSVDNSIEIYASTLGFKGLNAYTTYTASAKNIKSVICAAIAQQSYDTAEQWRDAFSETVILKAIENGDYTNVYGVITTNNDNLGISLTEYNALSKTEQQRALMNFAGKAYKDYAEVKSAFAAAVENAKVVNGGNSGGNGGSSGGGGGTSSGGAAGNANVSVIPNGTNNQTGFKDLTNYEWAKADIENLVKRGVVNGVSNSEFAPEAPVKREEFVKMLVLALGLSDKTASVDFDDVDSSAWYYPYIASAFKSGVVSGETENMFGVGKNITREQIAAMIFRALKEKNIEFGSENKIFADSSEISEYALEAIEKLASKGIISGYEDGSFKPGNFATRAEAAVIISRVCNLK